MDGVRLISSARRWRWGLVLALTACRLNFDEYALSDGSPGFPDAPSDSAPRANRAFVTSTTYAGNLGGGAAADAECQAHAAAEQLGGTFIALLRTDAYSPTDRLASSRGWVDLSGMPIADLHTDWLDGKMLHPLRRDQRGAIVGYQPTWTGYAGATCLGWTSADVAERGGVNNTTRLLNEFTFSGCSATAALVCVETGFVFPVTEAPQPGRHAFVTGAGWTPGGGLASADSLCASDAAAKGLAGTYVATLATTSDGRFARLSTTGLPWTRVDGIPLAPTAADLVGPTPDYLDSFSAITAAGMPRLSAYVWTGTAAQNCNDWASSAASVTGASGDATSVYRQHWDRVIDAPCDNARPLLCLQQ